MMEINCQMKADLHDQSQDNELGATNQFLQGKIAPDDEGELKLAIGTTTDGKIILNFGKSIAWFGMNPEEAIELAATLKNRADTIIRLRK